MPGTRRVVSAPVANQSGSRHVNAAAQALCGTGYSRPCFYQTVGASFRRNQRTTARTASAV
jgi:hypothetical protein